MNIFTRLLYKLGIKKRKVHMTKQCWTLLEHLQEHQTITTIEAIEQLGILRPASRVHDLKKLGYKIYNLEKNGKMANYYLVSHQECYN